MLKKSEIIFFDITKYLQNKKNMLLIIRAYSEFVKPFKKNLTVGIIDINTFRRPVPLP